MRYCGGAGETRPSFCTVKEPEAMFGGSIDLGITDGLVDRILCKDWAGLLVLEQLRHRDEIKRTYRRTIFDIREGECCRAAIWPRNRNLDGPNAFKPDAASHAITNTIISTSEVRKI